ncbi:MAG: hypothetical protein HQ582_28335, partial [Planctomycetes bacterium]|nr:hypothetical protein [Planctomycetota bacterium]
MKRIWLQVALLKRAAVACRPWLVAAVVLWAPGVQARADLREAVKKLLPATVAVEWRSVDSESARRTAVFPMRNMKAEVVADAVKELYRDRLSDPDMSVGVDATSNSLVVSAPDPLFHEVERLIHELDQAAKPAAEATEEPLKEKETVDPSKSAAHAKGMGVSQPRRPAARTRRTPDTVVLA